MFWQKLFLQSGSQRHVGKQGADAGRDRPQQIADDILRGVLAPGARLDEIGLANRFKLRARRCARRCGSSPPPGWWRCGRAGVIVSLPSDSALAEMFEVMGELEASCARLAALRMSPAERIRLELVHKRSRDAVRNSDRDSYRKINFEFHDAIYRGAHNDYLSSTTIGMRQRIAAFRRAQFTIPDRLAKSYQEHDAIVTAVLRADAETASELMRAHVNVVRVASSDYVHELERRRRRRMRRRTAGGRRERVGRVRNRSADFSA